MINHPPSVL